MFLNIKFNFDIVWIYFFLDNNIIGYIKEDMVENDLKEKLVDFLGENIWMIIGVLLVFVFFFCIGMFLFCKKWYVFFIFFLLIICLIIL